MENEQELNTSEWTLAKVLTDQEPYYSIYFGNTIIADIRDEDTSKRIIACVNSCSDWETEELENGILDEKVYGNMAKIEKLKSVLIECLPYVTDAFDDITNNERAVHKIKELEKTIRNLTTAST